MSNSDDANFGLCGKVIDRKREFLQKLSAERPRNDRIRFGRFGDQVDREIVSIDELRGDRRILVEIIKRSGPEFIERFRVG